MDSTTKYTLRQAWGSGPRDVWLAGNDGTLLHWDGKSITRSESATHADLRRFFGSGPRDIWAGGEYGAIRRWDGVTWMQVIPGIGPVYDLSSV